MRRITQIHILRCSFTQSHTHTWPRMHAWLCTRVHSRRAKPIIQSESTHKFSSVVAACPVKVRALFSQRACRLTDPRFLRLHLCTGPCFFLFDFSLILLFFVFSFLASGFIRSLCHTPFIHSSPHFILQVPFHLLPLSSFFFGGFFELKLLLPFLLFSLLAVRLSLSLCLCLLSYFFTVPL